MVFRFQAHIFVNHFLMNKRKNRSNKKYEKFLVIFCGFFDSVNENYELDKLLWLLLWINMIFYDLLIYLLGNIHDNH